DQKAGREPYLIEQVRGQRRSRGLPVRARDHEAAPAAQTELCERLRQRRIRKPAVDGCTRLDIVRAAHVADDHQVWCRYEMLRIVTLQSLDTPSGECLPHRGIKRTVAARHAMPCAPQEPRE